MIIYADELFAVNFVSNALLFYAYAMLRGVKKRHIRILSSAAAAALYAVTEAVFGISVYLRPVVLAAAVALAFGYAGVISNTLGIMFVSVCAEGMTVAVLSFLGTDAVFAAGSISVFAPELLSAAVYFAAYPILLLCRYFIGKQRRCRKIMIRYNDKEISFKAMYDSGNLLKYKGMPVLIIDAETAGPLFDCGKYSEIFSAAPDILRFGTVGKSGIMPVFVPDKCVIDGVECPAAAAVSERGFGNGFGGIAGDI